MDVMAVAKGVLRDSVAAWGPWVGRRLDDESLGVWGTAGGRHVVERVCEGDQGRVETSRLAGGGGVI